MSKSVQILGIKLDPLSINQLNELIARSIETNQKWIIANHNLHSVYIYHHDRRMRDFYAQAKYTHIDSMALVLLGKLLGLPLQREQRVTYIDWTNPLLSTAAQQGWRTATGLFPAPPPMPVAAVALLLR